MRTLLVLAAAILLFTGPAGAICDLPPPPPVPDEDPPPPPPPPPNPDPDPNPDPSPTPTPGPGPTPTPRPGRPPTAPPRPGQSGGAPRSRPRPRSSGSSAGAWHIWWELNREHLIGLRHTLAMVEPASGGHDTMGYHRERVRAALREVAATTRDDTLRATALRALGRAGTDHDARTFLEILRKPSLPEEVLEGAAIGLASLEKIEDESLTKELRSFFDEVMAGRTRLPSRARDVAIMTVSLRARDDHALVRSLGARCRKQVRSVEEAAAILFGCGLANHPLLSAEAAQAMESGKLANQSLHDVARAHAALGTAMTRDGGTAPALAGVLRGKKIQVHTRRAAAIALTFLLREGLVTDEHARKAVEHALIECFEEDRDPLTRGYAAIAMGYADKPFGIRRLVKAVDRTGDAVVKPLASLALGLAARRLGEAAPADEIRSFLVRELAKNRQIQLSAALAIANGLAGARKAKPILLSRVRDPRLMACIRGPACQGLALLGDLDPKIEEALVKALKDPADEVRADAAISLGFIGRRSSAKLIVAMLRNTKSQPVRAHLVAALAHFGGTAVIDSLLALLEDPGLEDSARASAAAALGILVDPREVDPLFEIDSCVNPYGLTRATRELVRVY